MLDKLTNASRELLQTSVTLASDYKNATITPLHTLKAALTNDFCRTCYETLHVPLQELTKLVDQELQKVPSTSSNTTPEMSRELNDFLHACYKEAKELSDQYISLEHFLLQWATSTLLPTAIQQFFKSHNIKRSTVLQYIDSLREGKHASDKNAEQKYQLLEKYCVNLTKLARMGKLDPVIGRDEEIRRVVHILSRRTKNNPVLVGDPGVGKTAIIEGIAQRIVNHDVPEGLKNKTIYALDLGLLLAGTKYQGEFEERLKGLLKDIEQHQESIILFIDEVHMLIGAGSAGGAMDAANLLKPALARGILRCAAATTKKEYKKYIESDSALERRFQPVYVEEPSVETTISILRGLKEKYELHHGVRIKDQALVDAAVLAHTYLTDRSLPDSAIDLIDEAAAMVKMSIDTQPEFIDKLDRRIRQLEIEKVALTKEKDDAASQKRLSELEQELANLKEQHRTALAEWNMQKAPLEKISTLKEEIEKATQQFQQAEREGNYARASEIKYGTLRQLQQDLTTQQERLKAAGQSPLIKQQVDEHDIALVLSRWTKIPVEKLTSDETERLLKMEQILQQQIVGQQEAIREIVHTIQRYKAGLIDPNRPIGTFLFLGPTGVGKTELAKALADFLFKDSKKIIRLDMSEYMEKHAVARLIGAPPGYIGYGEGGQLTEAVRRSPHSIILLDEIEKAHSDVFNLFLQIFDEGHLTDSQGTEVSFKNTIIILTSNIGSELILQATEINDRVKADIEKLLQKYFKPEFLNRIDSIVFFNRLSAANIENIALIQLKKLQDQLNEREIQINFSPEVISYIAAEGYSPEYGARPLKRAIQSLIIQPISTYILQHSNIRKLFISKEKDGALKISSEKL